MRLKDTGLTAAELKAQVKKYMIETYERMDFVADYAEGIYMYDENDQPYLDFYAGIAVNCLGNCNPKVVKAVQDQSALIMQTFNYPYTIPQAVLSKEICETIGMDNVMYQNSGAEANEAMIKIARKWGIENIGPDAWHIITAKQSFHGRTFGAMTATGQPDSAIQKGFGDLTPASPMLSSTTCRHSRTLMFPARPAPSCSSLFRARAACGPLMKTSSRASVLSATRRAS